MDAMKLAITSLAVFVLLAACSGIAAWRPVDSNRLLIQVTGSLEVLDMPDRGDVRLEVVPVAADRYALAPSQERLVCIIHDADRHVLQTQLLNVKVGHMVRIAGHWTAKDESGVTRHYLNDTTDLVPLP